MKIMNLKPVSGGFVVEELQKPNFKILSRSMVDGGPWYTVSCRKEVSIWLRDYYREEEDKQWFQNIDQRWNINFNVFDVNESVYTMLALRWS
jgi:hypothetical protein